MMHSIAVGWRPYLYHLPPPTAALMCLLSALQPHALCVQWGSTLLVVMMEVGHALHVAQATLLLVSG